MKYVFCTLGCRANQAQTLALRSTLPAPPTKIADFGEEADVYVINTCTVTADSEKKSRNAIRRALKLAKRVIVTGCYARLKATELKEMFPAVEIDWSDAPALSPFSPSLSLRVRENLMIEDGCENYCSYCIVPFARGPVRRKPEEQIIKEAEGLAAAGVKEIILTGINLGAWGELSPLLRKLSGIKDLLRVRLSSIEPQYVTDELIAAVASSPKLCRHFHIPLQSGDDGILQRMNRHYTADHYVSMIDRIRKRIPDCGITTDIIVGFPGESEKEFRSTVDLAAQIKFSRLHLFTYSKRDLTAAAKMPGQVDAKDKKARYAKLNAIRAEQMREFAERFTGKEVEVLAEAKGEGLTSNYIRVNFDDPDDSTGKIIKLRLGIDRRSGCCNPEPY